MKNQIVGGAVLALLGFGAGFIPQHNKVTEAESSVTSLQQQLSEQTQARKISEFRNSAALLYTEVSKNNFDTAGEHASKFFTDLRTFSDGAPAPTRQPLEAVLSDRDAVIAGIAKADPATASMLQSIFLRLQGI